ncbi:MAG: sialate O-acetylesterase, partial [Muribaculaceae bacterium]|nr:sialate O-acetylesterase [Muribaculaceae bacterium]
PNYPTLLYNAMIHPLRVMPVKGVLWYQGCSNIGRADQYASLFPALVNDWRTLWRQPDMPFYFVQLSGYLKPVNVQSLSEWAALRHAQTAALALPNTGMAVTTDLGNPADIHPADKHGVADRLARIALARDYGKQTEWKAPSYASSRPLGNKIEVTFNAPVKATSCAITGFIIGDADGHWAYAHAEQTSPSTILLSSPLIQNPKAARYNWADYPSGNLVAPSAPLPVPPFATDK